MKSKQRTYIPPVRAGYHEEVHHPMRGKRTGMTDDLRELEVGEYITYPRTAVGGAYACAKAIGMKVAVRGMGSKSQARVYRVE